MAGKVIDVTMRLIDKVTSPLNNVNAKLTASAKQWQRAGKDISKAGRSISNTGKSLTKTVTMPIVGIGTACVKAAADFEAGMSKVQSISGATGDEIKKLSDKALEMGKRTKFSNTEAADAFSYMAMAGWKTEDMLNGIEGVMYLAGATGEDLAQTSDIVTDALTALGMTTKDTNRFVDVLAAAASNANTDVGKMGETFKYVAPVAGAMKYSAEDLALSIGLMANSGIKASNAGTAMRKWLSNMAAPTDKVEGAMSKLGLSLTGSDGKMKSLRQVMQDTRKAMSGLSESEQNMYAKTLAGQTGMSGLLAIVNSSDKDFEKLAKAIDNSNGACEDMYKIANNNLMGQLITLKSTLESIATEIGQRLSPRVEKLTSFAQSCAEKFSALSNSQKDTVIKIAAMAAAVGPVLLVFGKMTSSVGKAVTNLGKFGAKLRKAGSLVGLITSPAGIVIGALAGIALAGVIIVKNWDTIKSKANLLKNFIGVRFKKIGVDGKLLAKNLSPIKGAFLDIITHAKQLWKAVKPIIVGIGKVVINTFKGYIGPAITAAGAFLATFLKVAGRVISGVMTIFDGLIQFITGVFSGSWRKAWEGVKDIFKGIFETFAGIASAPINAVIGLINGVIGSINSVAVVVPKWVPKFGGKVYSPSIPTIPALAKGSNNWRGGLVQISERGGEIVDLPSGSRVYPHDKSVQKAYRDGVRNGGVTIAKLADQIIVREEADIDKIANKLAEKLEKVALNTGGGELGYNY